MQQPVYDFIYIYIYSYRDKTDRRFGRIICGIAEKARSANSRTYFFLQ